jgi:7,8-dihydro-6-hydroxymethylpterin-pyrophosphokinase
VNACVLVETDLTPMQLLALCQKIEQEQDPIEQGAARRRWARQAPFVGEAFPGH